MESFLQLDIYTSTDWLLESLQNINYCIREELRESLPVNTAISYISDPSTCEEFSKYLLEWIKTWREDPSYVEELSQIDDSREGVDFMLDCLIHRLGEICRKYDFLSNNSLQLLDFVEYCTHILPKSSEDGKLDFEHEVTDEELEKINQLVKGILGLHGGEDFVYSWGWREENVGCTYPIDGNETDIEFNKDNVQLMIKDIVECFYNLANDEEHSGIWYDWNYMNRLMHQNVLTLKESDDMAYLIVEAVGWGSQKCDKPVALVRTLPDEIELSENEQRVTSQRFENLEAALNLINDDRADYCINISCSDSITLNRRSIASKFAKHDK